MQQTSKLSIVVDTSNAKQKLAEFTKQLNDVTQAAKNMSTSVSNSLQSMGGGATTAGNNIKNLSGALREVGDLSTKSFSLATRAAGRLSPLLNTTAQSSRALSTSIRDVGASSRSLAPLTGSLSRLDSSLNNTNRGARSLYGTMNILNQTINNTTIIINNMGGAANRAAGGLNNLGGSADRANRASRGLYGSMSKLYTLMNSGLVVVGGLGFIKVAADMQNLSNQIRLVTKSEKEYAGVKQQVIKIANENYNSIAATTSLYQKSARALGNLGKTQQEALKFTNAISMAMRVGGRSAGEQAAALLQLGQAMGAGVIMGDEFRSISENAPILLSLVAKRMGVMQGELKKMSQDGLITAEIMYDAVVENEKMLEDIAKGMPITMGQAFVLVKNKYTETVDTMMNKTGGFSDKLSGLMVGVTKNFETIINTIKVAGVLAFVNFAGSVNVASKAMAAFNFVMGLNPLVRVAMLVMGVSTAFYGLDDVLDTTMMVFNDLMSVIGTGLTGLVDLATAASVYIGQSFRDGANEGDKAYEGFFDNTEKGFAGFLQGSTRMVAAATSTLAAFFQWFGSGMKDVGRAAVNIFIWISNQVNTIFKNLGATITNALNHVFDNYNWVVGKANSLLKSANSPLIFKTVGDFEQRDLGDNQRDYLVYSEKSFSSFLDSNLNTLMPLVDRYYSTVAAEVKAGREKVDLSGDISTGLIDPSSPAGMAAMAARAAAEAAAKKNGGKKNGKPDSNQMMVYKAWRNAGLSDNQARIITAEVGREGDYQSKYLFGGHNDPKNGKYNLGMISWQKDRGKDLYNYLNQMGFIKGGKIVRSQEALNAQAMFGVKEMTTNPRFSKTKNQFLANSDIGYNEGTEVLGKNYIAWRYTDPKYAHHHKRRDNHYEKLNLELGNEDVSKVLANDLKAIEAYYKEQDSILKDYQSTPERIKSEYDDRLIRIGKAGFDKQTQGDLGRKAEAIYNRDMAVYQNSLDQKLDALTEYQQTETDKIERHREKLLFDLAVDPEYQLPENKARLDAAKKAIDQEYEYAVAKNQQRINATTNELYAFRKTERDILKDGYDDRISEAMLMNDELKKVRIEALLEEQRYKLDLFDKNQELQLLELSKAHMTEMAYIKAEYDLKTKLIALSSADDSVKEAQTAEAKATMERSQADVRRRVGGDYDTQTRGLFGISSADADLAASNQAQRDVAKKAFDEQYIQEEEYRQRLLDLETDFANKKQSIIVSGYESAFGMAARITKAFGGGQSRIYQAMYAVEKAFAFSRIFLENKVALAKAWASAPFPYNLPAVGTTALQTGVIASAVEAFAPQGFKSGGYTGGMGVNDVAGVVHGQEYVFDAQATKRIGVDNLNAMRSGQSVGGGDVNVTVNNHSSAKIETQKDDKGNIIMTIRDEVKRGFTELRNPNSYNAKMVQASFNTTVKR